MAVYPSKVKGAGGAAAGAAVRMCIESGRGEAGTFPLPCFS